MSPPRHEMDSRLWEQLNLIRNQLEKLDERLEELNAKMSEHKEKFNTFDAKLMSLDKARSDYEAKINRQVDESNIRCKEQLQMQIGEVRAQLLRTSSELDSIKKWVISALFAAVLALLQFILSLVGSVILHKT